LYAHDLIEKFFFIFEIIVNGWHFTACRLPNVPHGSPIKSMLVEKAKRMVLDFLFYITIPLYNDRYIIICTLLHIVKKK